MHTLKKSSSGPKIKLGRKMVASGHKRRTEFSANPFVLTYGMLLSGFAPMALKCMSFAPTFWAAIATFSAPFHCMSSNCFAVPSMIPTRDTTTLAPLKASVKVLGFVISKGTGGRSRPSGTESFNNRCIFCGLREDSWTCLSGPVLLLVRIRAILDPTWCHLACRS